MHENFPRVKTEKRFAEDTKYRRSLDDQSVRIFPVPGYGSMEIGKHRFYENHAGGPEKLDATPWVRSCLETNTRWMEAHASVELWASLDGTGLG